MDRDLRLQLLASLAASNSETAKHTLVQEIEQAAQSLNEDSDYARLEGSLAVLRTVGFRHSEVAVSALEGFIEIIERRHVTYSEDAATVEILKEYRTSETLLERAIETIAAYRYLHTPAVLHALLPLANYASERIRKKALNALALLAKYDFAVFYGRDNQRGIGALPQITILDEFDRLDDNAVQTHHATILAVLEHLLSSELEGEEWSYRALKLTRANTPADGGIPEVRSRSINWLKRLFFLTTDVKRKLRIVGALHEATRTAGGAQDQCARDMFIRDAKTVLAFLEERALNDDLEIVQKIEHTAYWISFHAIDPEVKQAALKVESAIARNAEYQIFRVLVGFDGIFGRWDDQRDDENSYTQVEERRRTIAKEYVSRVTENTYPEWRARILRYAQVESDDLAMFPVFYFFLERLAEEKPELTLRLLREDSETLERFLIPPFRGLWSGNLRQEFRAQLASWISEGRYLYPATKQFLANAALDLPLMQGILSKASEIGDLWPIREMISVAVSNYSPEKRFLIYQLILPALKVLTKHGDTAWVFDAWFRKELESVMDGLDDEGVEIMLTNLALLKKIDHHSEKILAALARRKPQHVLKLLVNRIDAETESGSSGRTQFEPLPFELRNLKKPLSALPEAAVTNLRAQYDGNYGLFIHRGARLLKIIFPEFPQAFETQLMELVRQGGEDNLKFVIAVLRNYEGSTAIQSVCKEIIKGIPADSPLRSDVAVALESTGVVSGEFGMAEAYERKIAEVQHWMTDPDEKVSAFAKWYVEDLQSMSATERKRTEEEIELGKFKYGE